MRRRGIISVWALVILGVVGVMTAAIAGHLAVTRKTLESRVHRAQAERLLDAGETVARSQLMKNVGYRGETLKLLDDGMAIITITPTPVTGTFQIAIEAHAGIASPRSVKSRRESTISLQAAR